MALATFIDRYNVLAQPTAWLREHFKNHPTQFKAALIVNHLFRAAAMQSSMQILPFSLRTNMGVCFVGSLFYRLMVEDNCAYKFALPAFAGGVAGWIAKKALIEGVALTSIRALVVFTPVALYLSYVVLTVDHDVDQKPCCK